MDVNKIIINRAGPNDFAVRHDGNIADHLCWDEMLSQIVSLTHTDIRVPRFQEKSDDVPSCETSGSVTEDDFYVVIEKDDKRLFRHQNDTSAEQEAMRLAREMPGKKFFVCRAYKVAKTRTTPDVVLENTDDIPF